MPKRGRGFVFDIKDYVCIFRLDPEEAAKAARIAGALWLLRPLQCGCYPGLLTCTCFFSHGGYSFRFQNVTQTTLKNAPRLCYMRSWVRAAGMNSILSPLPYWPCCVGYREVVEHGMNLHDVKGGKQKWFFWFCCETFV